MEPPQSSSSSSPPPSSKFCNECKTNEFKYKCPGCPVRSCSLPCVKAHKQRTGCTGKRQQLTEFVPLSKFDDNLILSDYNMLEDVKRIADSAKRRRVNLCGNYYGIPLHLRQLMNAARTRGIRLFILPNGMSLRQTNKTSYNKRLKSISWTIEWRFHSTNVKLVDHGVRENSNICSVIEKHLKSGPTNHPLKPFYLEPMESLKFYISKHPKQPRSPVRELDINAPLCKQLSNLVIIEYPVIHVFLPSHSPDVKVVKDIVIQQVQPKTDPVNDSQTDPKGVFFKEEEIKDHDSADPHVLDLNDSPNVKVVKDIVSQQVQPKTDPVNDSQTDPVNDSQTDPKGVFFKEEEIEDPDSPDPHVLDLKDSSDVKVVKDIVSQQVQPKTDLVNDSQTDPKGVFFKEEEIKDPDSPDPHVLDLNDKSNIKTETTDEGLIHKSPDSTYHDNELADMMSFEFEPELIDVYSSLISETNPDDFLDFDGLCDDLPSKEDGMCGVIKEELEEGEIADSD